MSRWHESELRARFDETDSMGVVYYSKFFNWMQVGVVGLLHDIGLDLGDLAKKGFDVVESHADYNEFVRFDERVLVRTRVAGIASHRTKFESEVLRLPGKIRVCRGFTTYALKGESEGELSLPVEIRQKLLRS
jgi:acyl-CoA thioester hydrolase